MTSLVKYEILKLLSEHPEGVLQSRIHKVLKISKSRVSEVLHELELQGMIARIKIGNQYLIKPKVITRKSGREKLIKLGIIWSSEYVFIAPFIKMVEELLNYGVEVVIYPNALVATWALVRNELDLALTPLITQLYAFALTKSLRIIGGGAYGGALIMYNPNSLRNIVISSELSTMDLCRSIAIKEGIIEASDTEYFSNPYDVSSLTVKENVKYVIAWHPLTDELLNLGLKAMASCSDLDINYCCTLAASASMDYDLMMKLSQIYLRALEVYSDEPRKWINWYSIKVGINPEVLARGISYYGLNPYIDKKTLSRLISRAQISMPDPSSLLKAIEG